MKLKLLKHHTPVLVIEICNLGLEAGKLSVFKKCTHTHIHTHSYSEACIEDLFKNRLWEGGMKPPTFRSADNLLLPPEQQPPPNQLSFI